MHILLSCSPHIVLFLHSSSQRDMLCYVFSCKAIFQATKLTVERLSRFWINGWTIFREPCWWSTEFTQPLPRYPPFTVVPPKSFFVSGSHSPISLAFGYLYNTPFPELPNTVYTYFLFCIMSQLFKLFYR